MNPKVARVGEGAMCGLHKIGILQGYRNRRVSWLHVFFDVRATMVS